MISQSSDFADAHPESEVIGTDISPIQPEWVPPNLKFEIEDCTQPWTYGRNTFDFIHIRYLFGAIPDWDALYLEAFKAVKPGGWVEAVDRSENVRSDAARVSEAAAMYDWGRLFNEVSTLSSGHTFTYCRYCSCKVPILTTKLYDTGIGEVRPHHEHGRRRGNISIIQKSRIRRCPHEEVEAPRDALAQGAKDAAARRVFPTRHGAGSGW